MHGYMYCMYCMPAVKEDNCIKDHSLFFSNIEGCDMELQQHLCHYKEYDGQDLHCHRTHTIRLARYIRELWDRSGVLRHPSN